MSFGSTFPLEIYEKIIDEVQDRKTWRICLSVSWSFRHLARRHLFHEVSFYDDPNSGILDVDSDSESPLSSVRRFSRRNSLRDLMRPSLLTKSGGRGSNRVSLGILPYVRSVKYHINPHDDILEEQEGPELEAHYHEYIEQMEATAEVFELLSEPSYSQVQTLRIHGFDHRFNFDHRARWDAIIPSLRQSIIKLCRAPNIQIIYMVDMENVPRNIFCGSPVKRLVTEAVHFCSLPATSVEDWDEFPGDSALLDMPHLQSFSGSRLKRKREKFYPEVHPPSSSIDKAMKAMSLEIFIWPDDLINVLGFATQRFLKLERLILVANIKKFRRNSNIQYDLRELTNLKFLTVQYNLHSRPKRKDRSFGKLFPTVLCSFYSDFLKHLKSTSILEITFNCTIVYTPSTQLAFVIDTSSGELASGLKAHRRLDALISKASAFPSLRRFNLNFRVQTLKEIQPEFDDVGLSDLVASNAFPSTKARSGIELAINPFSQVDQFLSVKDPDDSQSSKSSYLPTLQEILAMTGY